MAMRIGGASQARYDESQRILERLVLAKPPESDADANIRWGKPSDFDLVGGGSGRQQPTITIIWPPDPECDETGSSTTNNSCVQTLTPACEEAPVFNTFTEVCRITEDVRVENPDDSDQYVIVQRIKQIVFQGGSGSYYVYTLNPPSGA